MKTCDVAIIGSGPGGYVAALYASRKKMKVCVIEKSEVGGTCLNSGCMPTKSLINSAALLQEMKDSAKFGLSVADAKIDYQAAIARKDEAVSRLRSGIETLFRAGGVDVVKGRARLRRDLAIDVEGAGTVNAPNIIIAAGSKAGGIAGVPVDESAILSSDGILHMKSVPGSITIIGGGAIGCEFACLFNALGSNVTIVEAMDRILPVQSREASKRLESILKKRGCEIYTSSTVSSAKSGSKCKLTLSGGAVIESEKVLVSVGRTPDTDALGLDEAGVETVNRKIKVDDALRTGRKNVYAVGDCVDGPQLAHKASYDAIIACDNISGLQRRADYTNIPYCIWTDPQIASVGMSEEDARAKRADVKAAKFPYMASGKAYLEGKTEGFVKITGTTGGEILGVEILGAMACDLIAEAVLAKTMKINIRDWSGVIHGHPTISEVMQEAARAFCGYPIHSV